MRRLGGALIFIGVAVLVAGIFDAYGRASADSVDRAPSLITLGVGVFLMIAGLAIDLLAERRRTARSRAYQGRQRLGVVILLVSALATSACAGLGPHAQQGLLLGGGGGALIGYGLTGDGKIAGLGAGLGAIGGLTVGSVMDWFDGRERREAAMAAAVAAAQGVTSCTRQERWENGRLVTDVQNCTSGTTRAGFRGDTMPPGAVLPEVQYRPGSVVIDPYK